MPARGQGGAVCLLRFPCRTLGAHQDDQPHRVAYATVRLRTKKTKGCGSRAATLTRVFKIALETEKTWRRLTGKQIELVMLGRKFVDGEFQVAA